ncbi:hypothetical protein A2364_03965 [candidate division WWE3 bacterium RIFOXYB1_FULL_43_12]|nr:MAG: hypothetical protein A2364_03965 [candidate division WWE3 bacterium RIFOXYB1_FULL_43_12]
METTKLPEKLSEKIRTFFSNKYALILALIIIFNITLNIIWQFINTAPPTWDSAGHIVLSYIYADRIPEFLGGHVNLISLIRVSTYYPPFLHFLGSLIFLTIGRNYEFALMLGTGFLVIAQIYLYLLVKEVTQNKKTALLAVLIFSLFPQVWEQSRQYHLDVPLTALLLGAFYHLIKSRGLIDKYHSVLFFLLLAFAQLTKWYAFVFLAFPFLYHVFYSPFKAKVLHDRNRWTNLVVGGLIVLVVAAPWYVVNFKTIIQNVQISSTADAGDPSEVLSFESFFHYIKLSTTHQIGIISILLFIVSVSFLFKQNRNMGRYILWATVIPYFVLTLIQNKDLRYILPLTPLFAFTIACFFTMRPTKKLPNIGIGIYLFYLFFYYFFFSFNQYQTLPKNLYFISTLFAGPGYRLTWVAEPYSYAYNGKDWKGETIVHTINTLANDEPNIHGKYRVLEVSDNRFYSIASFDMYLLENRYFEMNLQIPYNRPDQLSDEELANYLATIDFAIIPKDPGPPGLRNIAVLRQLVSYFLDGRHPEFELSQSFDLPDGNVLYLFRRSDYLKYNNPALSQEHLRIYMGNNLILDRELLPRKSFNVRFYKDNGEFVDINYPEGGGNQMRLSLEGVSRVRIDLPAQEMNIKELHGGRYFDQHFIRDGKYDDLLRGSYDTYVYYSGRLAPKNVFTPFTAFDGSVEVALGDGVVNVTLADSSDSVYVAYAYNKWKWESAVLNKDKSSVSIPLQDLIQIEVTSKRQVIRGFDKMWDFFICYDGNAICFYPLTEIL